MSECEYDTVEILTSSKRGPKLIHRGYVYTVHKRRSSGGVRWRCTLRNHCKGSILTSVDNLATITTAHNHVPDLHAVEMARNDKPCSRTIKPDQNLNQEQEDIKEVQQDEQMATISVSDPNDGDANKNQMVVPVQGVPGGSIRLSKRLFLQKAQQQIQQLEQEELQVKQMQQKLEYDKLLSKQQAEAKQERILELLEQERQESKRHFKLSHQPVVATAEKKQQQQYWFKQQLPKLMMKTVKGLPIPMVSRKEPIPPSKQQFLIVPSGQRKNVLPELLPADTPPQQVHEEMCLRWNSHHTNMQTNFSMLLQREQYVDVTLCAEGQAIRCHRLILSSCSPYFEEIISNMAPWQHPVVFLKGIQFWVLKSLIDYMYIGEVNVEQSKLQDILDAAEELKIKGLTSQRPQQVKVDPEEPKVSEATQTTSCSAESTTKRKASPQPKATPPPQQPVYVTRRSHKRSTPDQQQPVIPTHLQFVRKGTKSRPTVKTPKFYHTEFEDDVVKPQREQRIKVSQPMTLDMNATATITPIINRNAIISTSRYTRCDTPTSADADATKDDFNFNILNVKSEPIDIGETDVYYEEEEFISAPKILRFSNDDDQQLIDPETGLIDHQPEREHDEDIVVDSSPEHNVARPKRTTLLSREKIKQLKQNERFNSPTDGNVNANAQIE